VPFADHYAFEEKDIRKLASNTNVDLIVTTEKDAVRILRTEVPKKLFYLSIEAEIERESELLSLILNRLDLSGAVLPKTAFEGSVQKHLAN
jgi:tetraacyldisaccharide-1-P 4'-kinase